MSCRTLRGFYFWKIDIPNILGHAHFEEISLLLISGQNRIPSWSNITLSMPDTRHWGTRDHLRPKRLILYCVFLYKVVRPTISLQNGEGDMHEVCEIAAKMSGRVPWTGHQRNHRTLFSNTVRIPSVQSLFGEKCAIEKLSSHFICSSHTGSSSMPFVPDREKGVQGSPLISISHTCGCIRYWTLPQRS